MLRRSRKPAQPPQTVRLTDWIEREALAELPASAIVPLEVAFGSRFPVGVSVT